MLTTTQDRIDPDLAVVSFSQLPAPLPGNANRFFTLFGHAGFINNQATVRMTAEKRVGVMGNLFNDSLIFPGGIGQKVLQSLIITVRYSFCHPFHILLGGLNQPPEVLFGNLAYVSCT